MTEYLSLDQLHAGLIEIQQSPANEGELKAIVIRPATDHRESLTECEISRERGVHGDNWADGCWKSLPDGSPHPDVQVAIMNSRAIALIAQTEARWSLAGDNLYVDFDLSSDNLPCGQRLRIGSVELEVTDESHNGCKKFAQRFGTDAVKFVNSEMGKALHLRGIYAKLIAGGMIHVGETVKKVQATTNGKGLRRNV